MQCAVPRIFHTFAGQAEDEVGRHARDAGLDRGADGGARARGIVEAAEELELLGAERLRADREPVTPTSIRARARS